MSDAINDVPESASRVLTRQKTADLPFFTPSSVSFNPKPYLPHPSASQPAARSKTPIVPSSQREASSSTAPGQKPLDVSYTDPDATFIRYPFTTFPSSELHPEGLSYNILADNPESFLDPADFRTDTDNDSNKIAYPQILEPPRGWCPSRKKSPNDKPTGAYEDDAPKLRCTFCRRSYAGVNAKSMWRRHVLEKHKIPMSNRRDGPHEGNGRGRSSSNANKENKRTHTVPSQANVATVHLFNSELKPPKLKTALSMSAIPTSPNNSRDGNSQRSFGTQLPLEPAFSEKPSQSAKLAPPPTITRSKSVGPALTFNEDRTSSAEPSPILVGQMLPPSSPLEENPQMSWRPEPGPSSPTRTPGSMYKHGALKMPWKFPSPSHPLHSSPDELCLAVPIAGMTGDGLRSSYVALQASPFPNASANQSQFSSPVAGSPLTSKQVIGKVLGWKRTKSKSRSKLPPLPDPSPRRPPYTGPLPATCSDAFGPTPDLSFSTDTDSSFSSFNDSFTPDNFSNWFEMNSPLKTSAFNNDLPDTPIRRSNNSSILDQLQLAKDKDDESEPSTATTGPIGLGLGFKFDLRTSYGAKRPRADAQSSKSTTKIDDAFQDTQEAGRSCSNGNSAGSSAPALPVVSGDADFEDDDLNLQDLLPFKRRKLFE